MSLHFSTNESPEPRSVSDGKQLLDTYLPKEGPEPSGSEKRAQSILSDLRPTERKVGLTQAPCHPALGTCVPREGSLTQTATLCPRQ